MRKMIAGLTACVAACVAYAGDFAAADNLLPYGYSVSRPNVEKGYGALNDGVRATELAWFTRWTQTTEIICELRETCELESVEIHMPKRTKLYLTYELKVSFDTGLGDFGDPVLIPGFASDYTKIKGDTDASCTNHVLCVKNPGRAVRVRVELKTDAHASVSEIRLLGRPTTVEDTSAGVPKGVTKTLENANWRLTFSPIGGRVTGAYSKAFGFELTDGAGSFAEEVWDRPKSRGFLVRRPYAMTYESGRGGLVRAVATGHAEGGGINFLQVEKQYRATAGSTALEVDYRFENMPAAMALQHYAPFVSAAVGSKGKNVTLYVPTQDGIQAVDASAKGREYWGHRPARGWLAAAAEDGTGAAITFPYADVRSFYSHFRATPTLDWRMIPVALNEGESYAVKTEVLPFRGLKTVSGAGGGLVGELANGECRVVSAVAGEVTAEAEGRTRTLTFAKPGALVSFPTEATTVVLKRGGAEACRLDARPATGKWALAPAGARREATIAEIDLCRYTDFPRQADAPKWGTPLPGRRLRVGVITGMGNLLEISRLQDRFDFEFKAIGADLAVGRQPKRALADPIFSDGENFGAVGVADVERGIAKVLKYDADVLLVGGLPFEAFNRDLQAQLVAKVKGGTGLVWIGQDRAVEALGFRLLDEGRVRHGIARAVGDLFSSVPFARLGDEPAYAIDATGGTVHAAIGDRPYLVETTLGEGRVFNLAYRTLGEPPRHVPAITPDGLRDFYETRTAPVEDYYSLVAKALLAAAKRELPVTFGKVRVTGATATVELRAAARGEGVFRWSAEDSFGRELAHGEARRKLSGGANAVVLNGLGIPPTQGPLTFRLTVATRKGGVLNWGAWAFEHAPRAEIVALAPDSRKKREGETLAYSAEAKGDTKGLAFVFDLVDSHGRTLATRKVPAAAKATGEFPVEDALLSRCYTLEARLVDAEGRQLGRRRVEIRVRPQTEKYAWDDFEVGIWASCYNREYFWPEMGELFRRMRITSLIANPWRIENDFAIRYNVHPTLLSGAGLNRCPPPAEYAKTGNKLTLRRPTCISSAKYFAFCDREAVNMRDAIAQNAYRFVWFGDELSLTQAGGSADDFCFSEDCLREMRAFAKGKYGTLGKLNAEWETSFGSWEEVVPFTRAEVQEADGRHVAGWADHREFMDSRLTNAVAYMVRRMKEADPDLRFGLSGTQQPNAYGGTDYWKQLRVLDAGLTYGVGGQYDIHRSLCPDGAFMPWSWGYREKGSAAIDNVWRPMFLGCRGLMGFQQTSMVNRDWTYSRGVRNTLSAIRRMTEGTGRHFVGNLRVPREVAVLYSQASYRAAFIEGRREEHNQIEEMVRRLLLHGGYAYDYVSYEQLAAGEAVKRGYRALVLPDSTALSDGEIAAIADFGRRSGPVIAYGRPATRHANCRPREGGALDALFADGRHRLVEKPDVAYVAAVEHPNRPSNRVIVRREHAAIAAALKPTGLADARVKVVRADTGEALMNAEIRPKCDRAGNAVWCVLDAAVAQDETRFVFPSRRWVYDLVSGAAHGETDTVTVPFGSGMPHAFALFREKVDLGVPEVTGSTLSFAYSTPVDGAVHVRLYRPDGSEATCYAKNVPMKAGRGSYDVPFAISDPKGDWKAVAESVFGRERQTVRVER